MSIANPFYSPEAQGQYEMHSIGRFDLEEGGGSRSCDSRSPHAAR